MLAYAARRLVLAIFTLWTVTVLSFIIIQLPPGDFVDAYMAQLSATQSSVSEQHFETLRRQYALDRPMYVQYLKWMSGVFSGDFGTSMMWRKSVLDVIGDRLTMTMVLSLGAIILTWAIALPIGIYSAVRQYSIGDYVFTFIGFIGLGVPSFLLALVLMYLGFTLFDSDIGGLFSPEYQLEPWSWGKVKDLIYHLPLPAIIIGLSGTAELIRVMRANLLDELRKPYVITARAAGMSERSLVLKYPVRVALNPFASTIGYLLPYILSGSVIVSVVLGLPTLGPFAPGLACRPRHVPGRDDRHDARYPDRHRHIFVRPAADVDRPAHPIWHGSVTRNQWRVPRRRFPPTRASRASQVNCGRRTPNCRQRGTDLRCRSDATDVVALPQAPRGRGGYLCRRRLLCRRAGRRLPRLYESQHNRGLPFC